MKIKKGFMLKKVSEVYVVIALGEAAESFNGMITLNETGAFLWEKLADGVENTEELVTALLGEYDVSREIAEKDVSAFVEKIKNANILA